MNWNVVIQIATRGVIAKTKKKQKTKKENGYTIRSC